MAHKVTGQIDENGAIRLPASLRNRFRLAAGSDFIAEVTEFGILIRPDDAIAVEYYSPRRMAEFLLSNSVDEDDYRAARESVEELGLNPDGVKHSRP